MPKPKKSPELVFQEHIKDFLVRVHKYGVLEQSDITDSDHFIAEDHLWAFLKAPQDDTLKKLTDDYGSLREIIGPNRAEGKAAFELAQSGRVRK